MNGLRRPGSSRTTHGIVQAKPSAVTATFVRHAGVRGLTAGNPRFVGRILFPTARL